MNDAICDGAHPPGRPLSLPWLKELNGPAIQAATARPPWSGLTVLEAEPKTLREAELEAENAHLRRLLDQAGQESERAFTRIAIADAQEAERQHIIVGELHHRA